MKTNAEKLSHLHVTPTMKDDLKAIAASRHITLQALTEQVLGRFVESRRELLQAAAEGNDEQVGES